MYYFQQPLLSSIRLFFLSAALLFFINFELNAETLKSENFSLTQDESRNFYNFLQDAIQHHPEKALQEALLAQEISQINIIRSDLGFKSYLEINSRAKPMDTEYDSFFQSIQQKDTVTTDQTVVLEKLLTDFGKTKNRILEYENIVQSQTARSANEVSKLALRMMNTCYDTAVYSSLLEILETSFTRHQEINTLISARVESGRAASRELSRSQARVAEAEARKILAASNLLSAQSRFKTYYASNNYCLKLPQITFSILEPEPALTLALEENDEIKSLAYQITALEKQIITINKSRLPTIKGQFTSNKTDISNTDDYILVGGITFNWPLYQGKRTVYEKQQSKQKLSAAEFELASKKLDIQSVIESNLSEISQSKLQEQSLFKSLEANAKSVEQLNAQFFSANVSLLELLQAERDYMDAAERYLMTVKELRMAQFTHLFYTGRLDEFLNMEFTYE